MQIYHVFCLAPHLARGGNISNFNFTRVEKLIQILSVAVFKKNHPQARFQLYADSPGLAYLQTIGFQYLYDGIDTAALDRMPPINHLKYWAGSKLFAYKDALTHSPNPIFIDLDAVLWCPLESFHFHGDLVAAHYEPYNLPTSGKVLVCPSVRELSKVQPFQLNASFVWFRNPKSYGMDYCERAIQYMLANPADTDLPVWAAMCFAEQMMLLEVCNQNKASVATLGQMEDPHFTQYWTHLWAQKSLFRNSETTDWEEAQKIMKVIQIQYPAYYSMAQKAF
jgi:hypothetical protein